MGSEKEFEPLVIPALGRPFSLGLLYNANINQLIPSLSLWDSETLSNYSKTTDLFSTNFNIDTSDTLEDKAKSIKADGNVKLGLLAGNITVGGSAKFLIDNNSSKHQANITLQYKQTEKHRELTADLIRLNTVETKGLTKGSLVPILEIVKETKATHIVTAITYGTHVNLVFKKMCTNESEKRDIKGSFQSELKALTKNFGQLSVQMEGGYESTNKTDMSTLEIQLFGDICLEGRCPTTFEDAIELYQKLPDVLKHKTVPITVYLLPLSVLRLQLPSWKMRVSDDEIQLVGEIFQELQEAEMTCNDLFNSPAVGHVPKLKNKPKQIAFLVKRYRSKLQQQLRDYLDSAKHENIRKLIAEHTRSPFAVGLLSQLLEETEVEIVNVDTVIKGVSPAPIVSREVGIQSYLNDTKQIIGLEVVLYIEKVPFMNNMEDYVDTFKAEPKYSFSPTEVYRNEELRREMQNCLKEFTKQTKAYEDSEDISTICYIAGIPNSGDLKGFGRPQMKVYSGDYLLSEPYEGRRPPGQNLDDSYEEYMLPSRSRSLERDYPTPNVNTGRMLFQGLDRNHRKSKPDSPGD